MLNVVDVCCVCSGSMEFVVPPADSSVFFPISVRFSATTTFSDMKVCIYIYIYGFSFYFIILHTPEITNEKLKIKNYCRLLI